MKIYAVILVPLLAAMAWLFGLDGDAIFDEEPPRVGEVQPEEGWCCRDPIWVDPYRSR